MRIDYKTLYCDFQSIYIDTWRKMLDIIKDTGDFIQKSSLKDGMAKQPDRKGLISSWS